MPKHRNKKETFWEKRKELVDKLIGERLSLYAKIRKMEQTGDMIVYKLSCVLDESRKREIIRQWERSKL